MCNVEGWNFWLVRGADVIRVRIVDVDSSKVSLLSGENPGEITWAQIWISQSTILEQIVKEAFFNNA